MSYRRTDLIFSDKQRYVIVELPKFHKDIGELVTELDSWVYLLKHMRRMQQVPLILNQGVFPEVLDIAEISNFTMEEHKMYRSSLQDQFDYENCLAYAKKEAAKEGRQEGRQEGLKESKLEFVQSLIRQTGFDNEKIANLAGVEEDFVGKVRSETKLTTLR